MCKHVFRWICMHNYLFCKEEEEECGKRLYFESESSFLRWCPTNAEDRNKHIMACISSTFWFYRVHPYDRSSQWMCSFNLPDDEIDYRCAHSFWFSRFAGKEVVCSSLVLPLLHNLWCLYCSFCWIDFRLDWWVKWYHSDGNSIAIRLPMLYRRSIYYWRENTLRVLFGSILSCWNGRVLGNHLFTCFAANILILRCWRFSLSISTTKRIPIPPYFKHWHNIVNRSV